MRVAWQKELGASRAHLKQRYAAMMRSTSTSSDDSAAPISSSGTLDAVTAATAMEYSIETCDTDMLESYHHSVFSDDTVIVDADVARICAVDAAVAGQVDWPISLPSS